jgi:hypothetical protein
MASGRLGRRFTVAAHVPQCVQVGGVAAVKIKGIRNAWLIQVPHGARHS